MKVLAVLVAGVLIGAALGMSVGATVTSTEPPTSPEPSACQEELGKVREELVEMEKEMARQRSMATQENAIKHHYVDCIQGELGVWQVDEVCDKYLDPKKDPWEQR